ncbi:Sugar lactone lactonase YvrE [Gracilibacillus orientalis]|uniref:Sugar lactone lactonase YvrE n=1 Tax=Gracilibacillus orientalis TaxID=334253 RepID=A0A1I4HV52_9BACI|nr:SMP-30/gluconolactonase/LRE family protein [Gracilibacillus orientalis]SFL46055.1 Sugar lactone lactonase YvrE [Gracilibacillus orientalis]
MVKAEVAYEIKALLGEGPCWDERNQVLYWTDITGEVIHRFNPQKEQNDTFEIGEMVGAVVVAEDGQLVLAAENGFYFYDTETKQMNAIHDPELDRPDNRFNDGKVDPAGRFWAGTMQKSDNEPEGTLYCMNHALEVEAKLTELRTSNGMAWDMKYRRMYFIDTPTRNIYVFEYDLETGTITNQRVAFQFTETYGFPDGMTIDTEGMLWIAGWGSGKVSRWNPETGEVLSVVEVPAKNITSCTFGGKDFDTLYITTAREGMTEEELGKLPLSGSLFFIKPNAKGLEANRFKNNHNA